jgi:hypothetical protein
MSFTLLSSPLQGLQILDLEIPKTNFLEVSILFYSPYIRLNGKMVIKASYERDLLPENNLDLSDSTSKMTLMNFYL